MFKEVQSGTGINKITHKHICEINQKKFLYNVTYTLIIYSSFLWEEFINSVGSTHPQIKFKMCYSNLICFVVLQQ